MSDEDDTFSNNSFDQKDAEYTDFINDDEQLDDEQLDDEQLDDITSINYDESSVHSVARGPIIKSKSYIQMNDMIYHEWYSVNRVPSLYLGRVKEPKGKSGIAVMSYKPQGQPVFAIILKSACAYNAIYPL